MMKTKDKNKQNKFFSGKTKVFAIVFICIICAACITAILVNRYYEINGRSNKSQEASVNYVTNFDNTSTFEIVQKLANTDGSISTMFSKYLTDGKINNLVKITQSKFPDVETFAQTILSYIKTNYEDASVPLTSDNILSDDELTTYLGNLNDMLNIWDQQLAKEGEIIISRRMEFLKKLSKYASAQNTIISGGKDTLQLSYDANISLEGSIQDNLYNALLENREKDISLRFTTVGPHRDDINIILNGKDAKKFGSQGQQRSITLAMKLASLYIYKDEMGEFPVLLLDDVLSELDPNRQQVFLESLKDIQCILSCTKYTVDVDANIINIENGKVKN